MKSDLCGYNYAADHRLTSLTLHLHSTYLTVRVKESITQHFNNFITAMKPQVKVIELINTVQIRPSPVLMDLNILAQVNPRQKVLAWNAVASMDDSF